jgi:hypothetical protein
MIDQKKHTVESLQSSSAYMSFYRQNTLVSNGLRPAQHRKVEGTVTKSRSDEVTFVFYPGPTFLVPASILASLRSTNEGDAERSGRVTWLSPTPRSDGRHVLPPSCLRGIGELASWHGCFLEPQHCRFRTAHVPTNAEGLVALFYPRSVPFRWDAAHPL